MYIELLERHSVKKTLFKSLVYSDNINSLTYMLQLILIFFEKSIKLFQNKFILFNHNI